MQQININELKPHPRNTEFFDDMTGEKWNEFLESIKSRGVIEPIVVTPDKTVVSGHQRVRACKQLGILTVMCDVHTYDNEDQVLQDLIETNIRQRGDVGGSAKKVGKRIKELERIYGIQLGNNQHGGCEINSHPQKTQSDLAANIGMDVRTLQNYKLLAEMIPEIEDLVDTGIVSKTTALAMIKNLSEQEQLELISSLDTTKKITQKKVEEYIEEIKKLKENPTPPKDYELLKRQLQDSQNDYLNLTSQYRAKVQEMQELRKQMEKYEEETSANQYNKKLKDSTIFFCAKVADFLEKTGGYIWLTNHINELPEYEKKSYISAVNTVYEWANTLLNNIYE